MMARLETAERAQMLARAEAARRAPGSTSSEVYVVNDVDRLLVELERGDRLRSDLEGQVEDLEIVLSKR